MDKRDVANEAVVRPNWYMWVGEQGFTKKECLNIVKKAQDYPEKEADIFNETIEVPSVRRSSIRWMNDPEIGSVLWEYVQAGAKLFDIDVEDWCDIQYTEYFSSNRGKYDVHHDVNWTSNAERDRKISIVVQLSDPKDYEGGKFTFDEVQNPDQEQLQQRGSILVFPSYLRHSVSPVTAGVRRTLVSWFEGPRWR